MISSGRNVPFTDFLRYITNMKTRGGEHAAIEHALTTAGLPVEIAAMRDLSGGSIHHVVHVMLRDGRAFVAKLNSAQQKPVFDEEAHSLLALARTNTVRVPHPLACIANESVAALLMTAIVPAEHHPHEMAWRRFGVELAALHDSTGGVRYGFEQHNHIGSTFQPNAWHDDWVEFNAINRLGFQLHTAIDAGLLEDGEASRIESVINRLDQLIPRKPRPSLLHGDLWSGNVVHGRDGLAVIDPACSFGDRLADIAMMKLFGGFPQSCFDAYDDASVDRGLSAPNAGNRVAVYQLYHVLNHVNIFGKGYAAQAMALANRLECAG